MPRGNFLGNLVLFFFIARKTPVIVASRGGAVAGAFLTTYHQTRILRQNSAVYRGCNCKINQCSGKLRSRPKCHVASYASVLSLAHSPVGSLRRFHTDPYPCFVRHARRRSTIGLSPALPPHPRANDEFCPPTSPVPRCARCSPPRFFSQLRSASGCRLPRNRKSCCCLPMTKPGPTTSSVPIGLADTQPNESSLPLLRPTLVEIQGTNRAGPPDDGRVQ